MKFAVASTTFWEGVGFDTTQWRKSADRSIALVHLEYAKILVPDAEVNENIVLYDCPSTEFDELLESEEWRDESIH